MQNKKERKLVWMIESIRNNMTWLAVPVAALAAGTVHILTTLALTPLILEVDPPLILRYMGALLLGPDVLTESGIAAPVVGLLVHYGLSLVFTAIIAMVVHRWGLLIGLLFGAILGLCVYVFNFYTMTLVFDWFFAINSTVFVISHIAFGAVAGGVYEVLDAYDRPFFSKEALRGW